MALLGERVAVHVVAVALPEAGLVAVDAAPARAPTWRSSRSTGAGTTMRTGPPWIGSIVLALEGVGDDRLVGGDVGERDVGRVAELGVLHHVRRRRLHAGTLEQVAHAHTRPRRVELAPLRDAVDVERQRHRRQRLQLVEVERERSVDQAVDRQVPLARRRTSGTSPTCSTGKRSVRYWPGGSRAGS